MLAKKTAKNEINHPKRVIASGDKVRAHLAQLEITEEDIAAAVKWARTIEPHSRR